MLRKIHPSIWILTAVLFGCSKEQNKLDNQPFSKSGSEENELNIPYEIYTPPGQDAAFLQLEAGLLELFDPDSEETETEITRAVWLWETGVNYLFQDENLSEDSYYEAGDDMIMDRTVVLTKSGDNLLNSDLREQLEMTYDDITEFLTQYSDYALTGADVQFIEEDESNITFKVVAYYFAKSYRYIWPATVPSATASKMAGHAILCGGVQYTQAAWTEMKSNIWGTLPHQASATNFVSFDTYLYVTTNKYINGEYLPGNDNPLFANIPAPHGHESPMWSEACLSVSHQNSYAQAIRNQIMNLANSKGFNVATYLRIDSGTDNTSQTAEWGYQINLANNLPIFIGHERISASDLGFIGG